MDKYTIRGTSLLESAKTLNGNISSLQEKATSIEKAIYKVAKGDHKASDLSSAYTAQTALNACITRLGEISSAMNTAAIKYADASAELSARANLTAFFMEHSDTLDYNNLMGLYSTAILSAGSATAGYEMIKVALQNNGYSTGSLGTVTNAVEDAMLKEAEELAKREEEAKWAKLALTGAVIVGGAVASFCTGGLAAPIVIGAVSGAVMAGGSTAIDEYAEHGWDTGSWDYAEIGKDAFIGGASGAATAWVGGNLSKGLTNLASQSQTVGALMNSSNAFVRVGTGAAIGSVSEVISGAGTRATATFITTLAETGGDLNQSLSDAKDSALDFKQIAKDAVLGGVKGGKQQYTAWKTEQKAIKAAQLESPEDPVDWERTSNTASEEKILREMEANGDLDVRESELSNVYIDSKSPRISEKPIEIDIPFNEKSTTMDIDEFYRQGHMQEDALNDLTVEEYFKNHDNYVQNGRASSGSAAQAEYRKIATAVTAEELLKSNSNLTQQQAYQNAADIYKKSAALHNPDQVVGGDPTQIHALGGSRENSAFGSLWGHGRAEQLYEKIVELTKNMTAEEMRTTRLNIRLNLSK